MCGIVNAKSEFVAEGPGVGVAVLVAVGVNVAVSDAVGVCDGVNVGDGVGVSGMPAPTLVGARRIGVGKGVSPCGCPAIHVTVAQNSGGLPPPLIRSGAVEPQFPPCGSTVVPPMLCTTLQKTLPIAGPVAAMATPIAIASSAMISAYSTIA